MGTPWRYRHAVQHFPDARCFGQSQRQTFLENGQAMDAIREAEGSRDLAQRANAVWKKNLAEYEMPPMDAAVDEAILDYVNRRKASFADSNV